MQARRKEYDEDHKPQSNVSSSIKRNTEPDWEQDDGKDEAAESEEDLKKRQDIETLESTISELIARNSPAMEAAIAGL